MIELRYTLITDGTSDSALLPILKWLLIDLGIDYPIENQWADLGKLPSPPKSLAQKINFALELYPCDLLFIHRDAEREPREKRLTEINQAIKQANINDLPVVCIIPIRMMEAWLLFNESAIRKVAENPCGRCTLKLPSLNKIENLPDPKKTLLKLLREASELEGRRLKKFKAKEREKIHRLADIINDFSPLNQLSAFQLLKTDLSNTLNSQGWL